MNCGEPVPGERIVPGGARSFFLQAMRKFIDQKHKKARGGGRGQDHFKKWRERKTEIDYKLSFSCPIRLLQLLTKLDIP